MKLILTKSFKLAIYSKGDKNSPKLALVLPGKLDSKDYPHMHSHVDYLARKGFFALTFDPPGTWKSPGAISLYTMTNYIKAANELIEYYGNKPTFIMGHSLGGGVALYVGVHNPMVTHFAVVMSLASYAPADNEMYPDEVWKEKGYRVSKRNLPEDSNKIREFRLPYSFFNDLIKYDMKPELAKSKKPKLFVLGKEDKIVTPESIRETYNIAPNPKELFELPWGHDYRRNKEMIEKVNITIGSFLEKYKSVS